MFPKLPTKGIDYIVKFKSKSLLTLNYKWFYTKSKKQFLETLALLDEAEKK